MVVRIIDPIEHRLDRTADHCKRRSQIVCNISNQTTSRLFLPVEAFGQLVERSGKFGKLSKP